MPGFPNRKLKPKYWPKYEARTGFKYDGVIITPENRKHFTTDEVRFHEKALKAFLKGRGGFTHGTETIELGPGYMVTVPKRHQTPRTRVDFFGNPLNTQ